MWQPWWKTYHYKLTYFSVAASLVALVQTSSASVERVFSQVKYIVETTGVNALTLDDAMLETRLMQRMNKYPTA